MAVHLRLTRTGRHKRPVYRVVAADSRMPRDGRFLEILGIFDPLKEAGLPELKQDRVLTWLASIASITGATSTALANFSRYVLVCVTLSAPFSTSLMTFSIASYFAGVALTNS